MQRPIDIGTKYQSDGLGIKIEALDDIDDGSMVLELMHALKRMNFLRQTIEGHRPSVWLAARWLHISSIEGHRITSRNPRQYMRKRFIGAMT